MVSVHETETTPTPSTLNLLLALFWGLEHHDGLVVGNACKLGSHGPWRSAMGGLGDAQHTEMQASLPAAWPIALWSGS